MDFSSTHTKVKSGVHHDGRFTFALEDKYESVMKNGWTVVWFFNRSYDIWKPILQME